MPENFSILPSNHHGSGESRIRRITITIILTRGANYRANEFRKPRNRRLRIFVTGMSLFEWITSIIMAVSSKLIFFVGVFTIRG